jgi:hypothetical protein
MRAAILFVLVLSLAGGMLADQGQGKGKGKPDKNHNSQGAGNSASVDVRFSSSDTRIISNYYGNHLQQLPPGLQKKVQRGGTLPPGWPKKVQAFPVDLERQLPPIPVGCRRVVYGPTAMLIQDATNVVLDIIELTR